MPGPVERESSKIGSLPSVVHGMERLAYKQMQCSLTREPSSKSREQGWDVEEGHQHGRETSEPGLKVGQERGRQRGPGKPRRQRKADTKIPDGPSL